MIDLYSMKSSAFGKKSIVMNNVNIFGNIFKLIYKKEKVGGDLFEIRYITLTI